MNNNNNILFGFGVRVLGRGVGGWGLLRLLSSKLASYLARQEQRPEYAQAHRGGGRRGEEGGGGRRSCRLGCVCDESEPCTVILEEMETMLALKEVLAEKLGAVMMMALRTTHQDFFPRQYA
jgi:hypothetical protein